MKKICIIITITAVFMSFIMTANADALNINAGSYILEDIKTGQVLLEKNPEQRLYPASTTKIMTALLALENGNLDQIMTASQSAVNDIGAGGSNIGIMAGEELRLEDLLNALLIKSANETANIIAENLAPTRKEFVDMMNSKALEIGATGTNFVNPCGLDNPNHFTTVSDMAKIARYAMTMPKFREIVAKSHFTMPVTNKHQKPDWAILSPTNKLLNTKSNLYTNITGIKTGFTSQAGNALVSSAVGSDGTEVVAVIIGLKIPGAEKSIFNFSKELLEYGLKNYQIQRIVDSNEPVETVPVSNAENDASVALVTAGSLDSVLPMEKSSWNILRRIYLETEITAPVSKDQVFGYYEYERNGTVLGRVNIVASSPVAAKSTIEKAKNTTWQIASHPLLKKILEVLLIIVLSFFLLRATLRKISRMVNSRGQESD